jgi:hypothetical protein
MEKKTSYLGFKLPAALEKQIRERAAAEERPVSNFLRRLVIAALAESR